MDLSRIMNRTQSGTLCKKYNEIWVHFKLRARIEKFKSFRLEISQNDNSFEKYKFYKSNSLYNLVFLQALKKGISVFTKLRNLQ